MADETTAPPAATTTTPPPADATPPVPPPKPDPKAELNERLKSAGLKLKARDREVAVNSIDDLMSRANRVFGVESLLEEAKSTKAEAENIKSWKQALDADDDATAQDAFDALSPKAQRNALKWLQKKAAAAQEEETLSPRERELRAALEESEHQRRGYEIAQQQQRQLEAKAQQRKEVESAREMATGMAVKTLEAMKAPKELAPLLVPRVARVLRVALQAGVDLTPDEVAAEVREGIANEHRAITNGLDAEGLVQLLGEDAAKKLTKYFLAKRRQVATLPQGEATATKPPANGASDVSARGTPRFFR